MLGAIVGIVRELGQSIRDGGRIDVYGAGDSIRCALRALGQREQPSRDLAECGRFVLTAQQVAAAPVPPCQTNVSSVWYAWDFLKVFSDTGRYELF